MKTFKFPCDEFRISEENGNLSTLRDGFGKQVLNGRDIKEGTPYYRIPPGRVSFYVTMRQHPTRTYAQVHTYFDSCLCGRL